MIHFQCPQCGKPLQVDDNNGGKNARCSCGAQMTVPVARSATIAAVSADGMQCPNCNEPIVPTWRACPACATQLAPTADANIAASRLPPMRPTEVQAGDNSVVKAEINKPVTINAAPGQVAVPPTPRGPMISVGAESVVKANIDASTNVHHHGQYVKHQTVIQESSVGSIVRLLTSGFSGDSVRKAEEQIAALPDEPNQLFAILAQTLRHIIRDVKKQFKQEQGLFNMGGSVINTNMGGSITQRMQDHISKSTYGVDKANRQRLGLCQKILDKLHDMAHNLRDRQLVTDIEQLDDCMVTAEQLFKKQVNIWFVKIFAAGGLVMLVPMVLMGLVLLFQGEAGGLLFILIYPAMAGGGYWVFQRSHAAMEKGISDVEKVINELAERRVG